VNSVSEIAPLVGIVVACTMLAVARATYYRSLRRRALPAARPTPPRALGPGERQAVLDVLHEPRFVDLAPAEVYATLLDESRYLCSERTMYRILAANQELRERRDQLRHQNHPRPELLATGPNELWSWDITKLLGPQKWTYFYLYVILDVFSRYVVGWMVATEESAALAKKLIAETCARQGIAPDQLTLHADRGSSMTSKPVALLLADLGVTKTHSRPYVSNDNPFSESAFKTLKYRPGFPERFDHSDHARGHCGPFFDWYNHEHRHGSLGLCTPHDVHYGLATQTLQRRATILDAAFIAHPERFTRRRPSPATLPDQVWINRPATDGAVALANDHPPSQLPAPQVLGLEGSASSASSTASGCSALPSRTSQRADITVGPAATMPGALLATAHLAPLTAVSFPRIASGTQEGATEPAAQ
jgi:putative transposase